MSQFSDEGTSIMNPSPIKKTQRMHSDFLDNSSAFTQSMSNLEKRLQTCDSIYKLGIEANTIREKEHASQVIAIQQLLEQYDKRITTIENKIEGIKDSIQSFVDEEFKKSNPNLTKEQILQQFQESIDNQFEQLQQMIDAECSYEQGTLKKMNRNLVLLKTTPKDESSYDEIEDQLHEVQKQQVALTDILNQMKNNNQQVIQ